MKHPLTWLFAGLLTASITALASAPALWLVPLIDRQTNGRFSLADVEGSFWQGSALLGAAAASDESLSPLLPGRCEWRISPLVFIGLVDIRLSNSAVMTEPISIRGNWWRWEIGPARLSLPADGLSALGAPLNTIQPTGQLSLTWPSMRVERRAGVLVTNAVLQLDLVNVVSALSAVKPLGAYRLRVDWQGKTVKLDLKTLAGPLLLTGKGEIANGSFHFSGQATAQENEQVRLVALMNLLGQHRQVNGQDIVALEF